MQGALAYRCGLKNRKGKVMEFSLTASTVLMMMAFAVPGYILIKTKMLKPSAIPAFATLLLYACQPFLTIFSFRQSAYSPEILANMGIVFAFSLVFQCFMLAVLYFAFKAVEKKKQIVAGEDALGHNPSDGAVAYYEQHLAGNAEKIARHRVFSMAAVFGNVGFLGVPLLEVLMPGAKETLIYSAVFIVSMNSICWTLGLTLLTGQKKYIKVKKLVLNPPFIAFLVAFPLFLTNAQLPAVVDTGIEFLGRMTTPLAMLILGMRFATENPKNLFKDPGVYFAVLVKLVVFPLCVFLITHWLPIDYSIKTALFILSCMPTATVVLSLAEIHKRGQKAAANVILLSTIFSMITVPLLLLLA